METARPRVANLDEAALARLRELEQELGGLVIVAYEQDYRVADLSPDQLQRLQEAEEQLGAILVAYERT